MSYKRRRNDNSNPLFKSRRIGVRSPVVPVPFTEKKAQESSTTGNESSDMDFSSSESEIERVQRNITISQEKSPVPSPVSLSSIDETGYQLDTTFDSSFSDDSSSFLMSDSTHISSDGEESAANNFSENDAVIWYSMTSNRLSQRNYDRFSRILKVSVIKL